MLGLTGLPWPLEHVREVTVAAVVDDRIAALADWAGLGLQSLAAGLRDIGPRPQVAIELLGVVDDVGDECPGALVALGVGQPLGSNDDAAKPVAAIRVHEEVEALHVIQRPDLLRVHLGTVEEEDLAAFELAAAFHQGIDVIDVRI